MFDSDNLYVDLNDPLINAMRAIEGGIYKIAIVLDKEKKVVGTITDGDVRRGLLNGHSIKSPIKQILNKNFKYIRVDDDILKAKEMMQKSLNPIRHLPVLDNSNKLKDLIVSDINLVKNKKNSVLIMAGGLGKRLQPYTNQCPKPMIRVNNIPILEIKKTEYYLL